MMSPTSTTSEVPPPDTLSAEELVRVFSDPVQLKKYEFSPERMAFHKQSLQSVFFMELPFDDIKRLVERERDAIFLHLDQVGAERPKFEHVGSTSIEGMPGTINPDGLLILPNFPPTLPVVEALLKAGFKFRTVALHAENDLWFFKTLKEAPCEGKMMGVHVVAEGNRMAEMLMVTRDTCNRDEAAFEEYRAAKLAAAASGDIISYKLKKGKNSLFKRIGKQVGMDMSRIRETEAAVLKED